MENKEGELVKDEKASDLTFYASLTLIVVSTVFATSYSAYKKTEVIKMCLKKNTGADCKEPNK